MNNRAAATERSPLNGSAPVASVPARSRTRVQSQWAKVGLSAALAVALVLAIFLSSRPAASTHPHEAAASTTATTATSDGDAATVTGGSAAPPPLVNGSEPWSCGSSPYETGYVTLANKKDDHYFYWFVESSSADPSKDPLVLWLTGGPGGSSMLALLTENGPCSVNEDGETTTPNAYAWNHAANVIWLDQPTGVGFSYSNAPQDDADRDEQNVGENIYWFLQGFLDKHPEFDGRAFFITGESYGGHYVPGAAHYIWLENQKTDVSHEQRRRVNLQGIAIGNGHTDPVIQYQYNAEMARGNSYNVSLLSDAEVAQMREDSKQCIAWTEQCQRAPAEGSACVDAVACWSNKLIAPYSAAQRNSYDLRKTCTQPTGLGVVSVCGADFSSVARYLDQRAVRDALGVAPSVGNWTAFNLDVMAAFVGSGDFSFSYSGYVADLLDGGVRVLIYAGDADLACNWLGNRAWTLALPWSGHDAFNAAEERAFVTQDPLARSDAAAVSVDAGVVRAYANFAFLRVYEAGHMVPTDQPAVALAMLQRFLRNGPF